MKSKAVIGIDLGGTKLPTTKENRVFLYSMTLAEIKLKIRKAANGKRAKLLQRFFHTGPGGYGEGYVFLGLTVPQSRQIAGEFRDAPLKVIQELLISAIHEERLIALLILIHAFKKAGEEDRKKIFDVY